ncbi:agmatine deiminase family protein [Paraglaciecola marina]|uniref:agmatine deiminase family protein n=1 Tax=Paraglaciecola marina TaxID=2500157 RepID=UPI00105F4A87|nr:agmatine deiminase family protein [Paraglaciecola marina]
MINKFKLLPEWVAQDAVILAWPDENTDWQPWLNQARAVYIEIINTLNLTDTAVILLVRQNAIESCKRLIPKNAKVLLVTADYNDTWLRDYGFLSVSDGNRVSPIEFTFNGWGEKFDASKDNQINKLALQQFCISDIHAIDLVLEGGAIEIDDNGHLLSTALCLQNPKRNGVKSLTDYQQDFASTLGATTSTILKHGHLEGDDTDGHIDTLVRFTPTNGLVIQTAFNRPKDPHFRGLDDLKLECIAAFPNHQIFELPLPHIVNNEGQRLPASYANFLISNQHILCPIYQQPEDELAIVTIKNAYPDFTIVAINCLPLVQQFGSLHCITMQVPEGVLKPEVLQSLKNGVFLYE